MNSLLSQLKNHWKKIVSAMLVVAILATDIPQEFGKFLSANTVGDPASTSEEKPSRTRDGDMCIEPKALAQIFIDALKAIGGVGETEADLDLDSVPEELLHPENEQGDPTGNTGSKATLRQLQDTWNTINNNDNKGLHTINVTRGKQGKDKLNFTFDQNKGQITLTPSKSPDKAVVFKLVGNNVYEYTNGKGTYRVMITGKVSSLTYLADIFNDIENGRNPRTLVTVEDKGGKKKMTDIDVQMKDMVNEWKESLPSYQEKLLVREQARRARGNKAIMNGMAGLSKEGASRLKASFQQVEKVLMNSLLGMKSDIESGKFNKFSRFLGSQEMATVSKGIDSLIKDLMMPGEGKDLSFLQELILNQKGKMGLGEILDSDLIPEPHRSFLRNKVKPYLGPNVALNGFSSFFRMAFDENDLTTQASDVFADLTGDTAALSSITGKREFVRAGELMRGILDKEIQAVINQYCDSEQKVADFNGQAANFVEQQLNKMGEYPVPGGTLKGTMREWYKATMDPAQMQQTIQSSIAEKFNHLRFECAVSNMVNMKGPDGKITGGIQDPRKREMFQRYANIFGKDGTFSRATWNTIWDELMIQAPLSIGSLGLGNLAAAVTTKLGTAVIGRLFAAGSLLGRGLQFAQSVRGLGAMIRVGNAIVKAPVVRTLAYQALEGISQETFSRTINGIALEGQIPDLSLKQWSEGWFHNFVLNVVFHQSGVLTSRLTGKKLSEETRKRLVEKLGEKAVKDIEEGMKNKLGKWITSESGSMTGKLLKGSAQTGIEFGSALITQFGIDMAFRVLEGGKLPMNSEEFLEALIHVTVNTVAFMGGQKIALHAAGNNHALRSLISGRLDEFPKPDVLKDKVKAATDALESTRDRVNALEAQKKDTLARKQAGEKVPDFVLEDLNKRIDDAKADFYAIGQQRVTMLTGRIEQLQHELDQLKAKDKDKLTPEERVREGELRRELREYKENRIQVKSQEEYDRFVAQAKGSGSFEATDAYGHIDLATGKWYVNDAAVNRKFAEMEADAYGKSDKSLLSAAKNAGGLEKSLERVKNAKSKAEYEAAVADLRKSYISGQKRRFLESFARHEFGHRFERSLPPKVREALAKKLGLEGESNREAFEEAVANWLASDAKGADEFFREQIKAEHPEYSYNQIEAELGKMKDHNAQMDSFFLDAITAENPGILPRDAIEKMKEMKKLHSVRATFNQGFQTAFGVDFASSAIAGNFIANLFSIFGFEKITSGKEFSLIGDALNAALSKDPNNTALKRAVELLHIMAESPPQKLTPAKRAALMERLGDLVEALQKGQEGLDQVFDLTYRYLGIAFEPPTFARDISPVRRTALEALVEDLSRLIKDPAKSEEALARLKDLNRAIQNGEIVFGEFSRAAFQMLAHKINLDTAVIKPLQSLQGTIGFLKKAYGDILSTFFPEFLVDNFVTASLTDAEGNPITKLAAKLKYYNDLMNFFIAHKDVRLQDHQRRAVDALLAEAKRNATPPDIHKLRAVLANRSVEVASVRGKGNIVIYRMGEIGRGSFGVVSKGFYVNAEGKTMEVVVKDFPGSHEGEYALAAAEEMAIAKDLASHQAQGRLRKGIISVEGYSETSRVVVFGLVTTKDQGVKRVSDYSFKGPVEILKFMVSLFKAIKSLHEVGIFINDIKPHNILVDEHGEAVIIDVGSWTYGADNPGLSDRQRLMTPEAADRGGKHAIIFSSMYAPDRLGALFGKVHLNGEHGAFGFDLYSLGRMMNDLMGKTLSGVNHQTGETYSKTRADAQYKGDFDRILNEHPELKKVFDAMAKTFEAQKWAKVGTKSPLDKAMIDLQQALDHLADGTKSAAPADPGYIEGAKAFFVSAAEALGKMANGVGRTAGGIAVNLKQFYEKQHSRYITARDAVIDLLDSATDASIDATKGVGRAAKALLTAMLDLMKSDSTPETNWKNYEKPETSFAYLEAVYNDLVKQGEIDPKKTSFDDFLQEGGAEKYSPEYAHVTSDGRIVFHMELLRDTGEQQARDRASAEGKDFDTLVPAEQQSRIRREVNALYRKTITHENTHRTFRQVLSQLTDSGKEGMVKRFNEWAKTAIKNKRDLALFERFGYSKNDLPELLRRLEKGEQVFDLEGVEELVAYYADGVRTGELKRSTGFDSALQSTFDGLPSGGLEITQPDGSKKRVPMTPENFYKLSHAREAYKNQHYAPHERRAREGTLLGAMDIKTLEEEIAKAKADVAEFERRLTDGETISDIEGFSRGQEAAIDRLKSLKSELDRLLAPERRAEIEAFFEMDTSPADIQSALSLITNAGRSKADAANFEAFLKGFTAEFSQFFPAWEKFIGEGSYQHAFHDYKLGVHMVKVLFEMRNTKKYQSLSKADQRIADMVTLLHDIAKETGTMEQRKGGKINPDPAHPLHGAEQLLLDGSLQKLGFSQTEVDRIVRLIQYHDAVSNLAIYGEGNSKLLPDPSRPSIAAHTYERVGKAFEKHPEDLEILEGFVEGDIKGVQAKNLWDLEQRDEYLRSFTVREKVGKAFKKVKAMARGMKITTDIDLKIIEEGPENFRTIKADHMVSPQILPRERLELTSTLEKKLKLARAGKDAQLTALLEEALEYARSEAAFFPAVTHGTNSVAFNGILREGALKSAKSLREAAITPEGGEGARFGGEVASPNVFVGLGEAGAGTALAYAQVKQTIFEPRKMTTVQLEARSLSLRILIDNFSMVSLNLEKKMRTPSQEILHELEREKRVIDDLITRRKASDESHEELPFGVVIGFQLDLEHVEHTPVKVVADRGRIGPLAGEATLPDRRSDKSLILPFPPAEVFVPAEKVNEVKKLLKEKYPHAKTKVHSFEAVLLTLGNSPIRDAFMESYQASVDVLSRNSAIREENLQQALEKIQKIPERRNVTDQDFETLKRTPVSSQKDLVRQVPWDNILQRVEQLSFPPTAFIPSMRGLVNALPARYRWQTNRDILETAHSIFVLYA